ncbi:MAG: hypothetical protein K2G84_09355, partial [Muribaculaceae bacterium]|nr:hypothetical protein [Muribaculaceae bacterium]
MKSARYISLLLAGASSLAAFAAGDLDAEYGGWKFEMSSTKKMTITQDGKKLLTGVTMTALDPNDT